MKKEWITQKVKGNNPFDFNDIMEGIVGKPKVKPGSAPDNGVSAGDKPADQKPLPKRSVDGSYPDDKEYKDAPSKPAGGK